MSFDRKNSSLDKYRRKKIDEEDEKSYLSKETLRRREDQKLIQNITSALYRLEMENVKPSYDVKIKAGLHRGPYKSKRVRRSYAGADEFDEYGRPAVFTPSYAPPPPPFSSYEDGRYRTKLPDISDDDIYNPQSSTRPSWLPSLNNYNRKRFDQSPIDQYSTLPSRWLREMEKIDEDGRRRAVEAGSTPFSRGKSVADEYGDLMASLARDDPGAITVRRSVPGPPPVSPYFDDYYRVPDDEDEDDVVEQLFNRPFGGGRGQSVDNDRAGADLGAGNWRQVDRAY